MYQPKAEVLAFAFSHLHLRESTLPLPCMLCEEGGFVSKRQS